jgi:hypothetical protein
MMLTWIIAISLGNPEVPTWTADDVESTVDPDALPVQANGANPSSNAASTESAVVVQVDEDIPHGWADERDLLVWIAADLSSAYFIVGTARGDGFTAHWRQGPIFGIAQTVEVPLELPIDLINLLPTAGPVDVHLMLHTTTLDGVATSHVELGRTQVVATANGPVGVPVAERDTTTILVAE